MMEQLIYFGLIIICMALSFSVGTIWNDWREKKELKERNKDFDYDEMTDEHFGDLL